MNIYVKKSRLYRGSSTSSGQKGFLLQGNYGQKLLLKVVILFFILLFLNFFQNQIRNLFYITSYPVSNYFLHSGNNTNRFFTGFLNTHKLEGENFDLKKENQDLLSQISLLEDKFKEDNDLKVALQAIKDNGFKIMSTKVVGISLDTDSITIDRGTDDGILENMPLISKEKVIFGKVIKAYKNFSQVVLISAKNNTFDVKMQSEDSAQPTVYGALKGKGNLSVYLDLVNFESEIKEGDVLVTSGLEGVFPRDLLVGQITSVNKSDLKPFQTAEVHPFFEIKNIENLFVITDYKNK